MQSRFKNIKELRKYSKYTQQRISDLLGMSVRNYREKESGKLPFTQLEMMKLIDLFKLEQEESFQIFYISGFKSSFWINDCIKTSSKF